ncbi:MAG: 50S ribosomal protein L32 [Chloroflexi bacterium RBG_16_50_9]|nr:MAG: 50S ribosomal protein L32 [Chloroflexi bacterium RBG_16_50_9]
MGPLPKRKVSHARAGKRRSHLAIKPSALESCPQCHNPKLPHHACPTCGTYNGREVIKIEKSAKAAG